MLAGNVGLGAHPSWALAGSGDSMSPHPGHCTTPSPGRLPQEILTSPEVWWPQARGHKQELQGLFFVLHPANLPGLCLKNFFLAAVHLKEWAEPWLVEPGFASPECTE